MRRLDFGHVSTGATGALLMQSHQLNSLVAGAPALALEPAADDIAASG